LSRKNFIDGGRKGNARTNSHIRADKQEEEWATRLQGGVRVPGSGAGPRKGDVEGDFWRLECKTTGKNSFTVTREMISKIEEAALAHGQTPALVIEFNDDGKKVMEVAIVPTWVLENVK
jgi:Holliday junction resolvase